MALLAIDIGGSLAKIAYYGPSLVEPSTENPQGLSTRHNSNHQNEETTSAPGTPLPPTTPPDTSLGSLPSALSAGGYKLHLKVFETKHLDHVVSYLEGILKAHPQINTLYATGGGAHKYTALFNKRLGVTLKKLDEMKCLIFGCNFLLRKIPDEVFIYDKASSPPRKFLNTGDDVFPYLLVNVGSGVSLLKVEDENRFERIDGSSVGGGTFWGLGSLLTDAPGFEPLIALASEGNGEPVNMLVKDIYGEETPLSLGLDGGLLASSFGKAARTSSEGKNTQFNSADIAKSLLDMISYNVGHIAYLNARLHGLTRVYFGGFFIRGHPETMHAISFSISYWSKQTIQAHFLRHEGYLGVIGAFLQGHGDSTSASPLLPRASPLGPSIPNLANTAAPPSPLSLFSGDEGSHEAAPSPPRPSVTPPPSIMASSWKEKFVMGAHPVFSSSSMFPNMLELEYRERDLSYFPLLLSPLTYKPDTINLNEDNEAKRYWIDCFRNRIDDVVQMAAKHENDDARAKAFGRTYEEHLKILEHDATAYGELSVRLLLDIREQCLQQFRFRDFYVDIKKRENAEALAVLPVRLAELDALPREALHRNLLSGILAGNCFDWGSKVAADRIKNGLLDFNAELLRINATPWLVDHSAQWEEKMGDGRNYRSVMVFADNCGADIVLGIFPFVRWLLREGAQVTLAVNALPVLNDITANELHALARDVASLCPIVALALKTKKLRIMESGNVSPCLDLRRIDHELARLCMDVDLVVIEGMGRAIHTNYHCQLKCDVLKIATIKNQWLSEKMGGTSSFESVCKFEVAAAPDPV